MRTALLALSALVSVAASAQPPAAALVVPRVSASAEHSGDVFRYTYTVSNGATSARPIMMMGLFYNPDVTLEIAGAPPGWLSNLNVGDETLAGWTALSRAMIQPGHTSSGFILQASGLPGIVDGVVVGLVPLDELPRFPDGQAPEDVPGLSVGELGVKIRVVGPVSRPQTFVGTTFLQYLHTLADQASQQGWINDQGILISLQAKLSAAQRSVNSSDFRTARNQLSAVLKEVGAQRGKGLSMDAAALLSGNVEYAIQNLR